VRWEEIDNSPADAEISPFLDKIDLVITTAQEAVEAHLPIKRHAWHQVKTNLLK
jgi:hypothetical protein